MRIFTLGAALCTACAFRTHKSSSQKLSNSEGDCYSQYDGKWLIELEATPEEQIQIATFLNRVGCFDLGDEGSRSLTSICDDMHAEKVSEAYQHKMTVVSTDAGAHFRQQSGTSKAYFEPRGATGLSDAFYSDWRNYADRLARLEAAVSNSGGAARMETIGQSFEGRPIKAVRITGQGYASGQPKVILSFQLHPREWLAGMTGVYAAEKFVARAAEDPSWLQGTEVVLVPMANPDGILYSESSQRFWRKNRRVNASWDCVGVDLNRNWDPEWGGSQGTSSDTCSEVFFGTGAFSEPETQALKKVIDESPMSVHLDVHAYSELILAPWGFSRIRHPRRDEMDVLGLGMQSAIYSVHGTRYKFGGVDELLYPASGGVMDYSTSTGGIGLTYEMSPAGGSGGFAPPPSTILRAAEECLQGFYTAVTYAKGGAMPDPMPPDLCPNYCEPVKCRWSSCRDKCDYCNRR